MASASFKSLIDNNQQLSAFNLVACVDTDFAYYAVMRRNDAVLHFHGLNNCKYLAGTHLLTVFHLHCNDSAGHW